LATISLQWQEEQVFFLGISFQKSTTLAPTTKIKLIVFHPFWIVSKIQGVTQLKPGICFDMPLV